MEVSGGECRTEGGREWRWRVKENGRWERVEVTEGGREWRRV